MTNSPESNQVTLDGGIMTTRSDSERLWIITVSKALWNKPLGFCSINNDCFGTKFAWRCTTRHT